MPLSNIKQGTTRIVKFTFTELDGSVKDITGWTIYFTAKAKISDDDVDALIDINSTVGAVTGDDAPNGIMHVVIGSNATNVTPQNLAYNFSRHIAGSPPDVVVLEQGTFELERNVRQSTP